MLIKTQRLSPKNLSHGCPISKRKWRERKSSCASGCGDKIFPTHTNPLHNLTLTTPHPFHSFIQENHSHFSLLISSNSWLIQSMNNHLPRSSSIFKYFIIMFIMIFNQKTQRITMFCYHCASFYVINYITYQWIIITS